MGGFCKRKLGCFLYIIVFYIWKMASILFFGEAMIK